MTGISARIVRTTTRRVTTSLQEVVRTCYSKNSDRMCRIGNAGLVSFVSQAVVCGIGTAPKTALNLYVYRFKNKVWIPALRVEFSPSLQR